MGGQVCLPDGSGFGDCDCGSDAGTDSGTDAAMDATLDVGVDSGDVDAGEDAAADTAADAGPDPDECDPLTNTGCGPDQKCSWLRDEESGSDGRTTCVPDGDVVVGDECMTVGEAGGFTDDCVGGAFCFGGECSVTCDDADDMCADGTHCIPLGGVFGDREDVGVCIFSCDVLTQDCDGDENCYINLTSGEPSCGLPAADAGSQGDACPFLNSCEAAHGCVLDYGLGDGLECAFYCDPDSAGGPECDDVGGPGAAFTCVAFQDWYAGLPATIPDTIGMCVDCTRIDPGTRGCP